MHVSVLIPFRGGDAIRDRNLEWITYRLEMLHPGWEIITEMEPPSSDPFCKAAALNRAVRRSRGGIVIQHDSEVFAQPELMEQLVSQAQSAGWALFERVHKLSPEISERICNGAKDTAPPELAEGDVQQEVDCRQTGTWYGFCTAVRRDKWIDLDERFQGWGYEDVAWRYAMETLVGPPGWVSGDLYHLWHPLTNREQSYQSGMFRANERLYRQYYVRNGKPEAMTLLVKKRSADRPSEPRPDPYSLLSKPKSRAMTTIMGAAQAKAQRDQLARYLQWVREEGGHEGPTHLDTLFQPHQQERLRWMKGQATGDVMELGCCWGYALGYVGGSIGVDWNEHSIELARILNPGKQFHCQDIRKLSFGDKSVDTVIIPDVLEHLPWQDVPGVIKEAQRVARQKVLITLPAPDAPSAASPKHQWVATADRQAAIIKECGGRLGKLPGFVTISWERPQQLPIVFLAHRNNYVDHLRPIYQAFNGRSVFLASDTTILEYCHQRGIEAVLSDGAVGFGPGILVVAGVYHDRRLRGLDHGKKQVLLNHGSGQSWRGNPHSAYAGGPFRTHFNLILEPGDEPAEKDRLSCPHSRVVAIGCPKLDRWAGYQREGNGLECIAIGFHQPTAVCPESHGCFDHYKAALPGVVNWCRDRGYEVIGAGHPTMWGTLRPFWELLGVEPVADWDEVMARATLYVRDQCSTIYEFASLDKPVVVLNSPKYRRNVEHGLRFWATADVGINCDRPEDLIAAIQEALLDAPDQQEKRRRAVARTYKHLDGKATERAVAEILRLGG